MPLVRIRVPHKKACYDLPKSNIVRSSLGKKIREKREAFNISQIELAQALGKKSAAYIAFIESGQRNISAAELIRLSVFFRISLSFFNLPLPSSK